MKIPLAEHIDRDAIASEVLERFLRYVKISTTSDLTRASDHTPSTECQWDLLRLLETELRDLGIEDVTLNEKGYLIARIPDNRSGGREIPTIGFMAHVDTSEDAPGSDVRPMVHQEYDGKPIVLEEGVVLDPADFPVLANYVGETVVTADGRTLLGADDKAGIAEIMTAASWWLAHPEQPHGEIEIIFTPDEETGHGMDQFPVESLRARFAYTMDGSVEGEIESECYYAAKTTVSFEGVSIHPGTARGKLVNAASMAAAFVSMLPRNESPEATDRRFGNYWCHSLSGRIEKAEAVIFFRSFDREDLDRRSEALERFAGAVEAAFPGGIVRLEKEIQYLNMREEIEKHPEVLEKLREAVRRTGIDPVENPIRGGTDGSRLTAMGIPTPNIFAGGMNFHGRTEWVALPAMVRAVSVILHLTDLWVL